MESEAVLLLSYAMSGSGDRWKPDLADQQRYADALAIQVRAVHQLDAVVLRYPVILGGLDIVSRFLYPRSVLQQKLIVAVALVECHPASAVWLLPRDRSLFRWTIAVIAICLKILGKLCVGVPLLLFRRFLLRNVGRV